MKLSIITTTFTLLSTAAAVPLGELAAQFLYCWSNSIDNTTTSTSPLVTDCKALAKTEIKSWVPTEANNYTWALSLGTCGFKGVYNCSGALNASDVLISGSFVQNSLNNTAGQFARDGRASSKGVYGCMLPGEKSLLGFTNWEIYNVE